MSTGTVQQEYPHYSKSCSIFQDDNIHKTCGSFTKVVSEPILHEAKELSSVFGNLFHLFAVCRQTYSIADRLTEPQTDELGTV